MEREFIGNEWRFAAGGWQYMVAVYYYPATGRYREWPLED